MENASNVHHVSKDEWDKWPEASRRVFNSVYERSKESPKMYQHADKKLHCTDENWRVTTWNMAWLAANETSKVTV